jgi:hypothetical protein
MRTRETRVGTSRRVGGRLCVMRVLVVPHCESRGAVAVGVVLGGFAGVAAGAAQGRVDDALWAAVTLGPEVLAGILAALLARSAWAAARACFVFSAAHGLASALWSTVFQGNQAVGMALQWAVPLTSALVASILGIATALWALALYWLRSRLLFTTILQDGTLCWRCGYCRGSTRVVRCPECGVPAPAGIGQRLARVFQGISLANRWGRVALVAGAATMVAIVVLWAVQPKTRRLLAFYTRFHEPLGAATRENPAVGAWLGFEAGSGPGLWISYMPEQRSDGFAMELRLARMTRSDMGDCVAPVTPAVTCRLDRAQSEAVVANGIPASLHARFRKLAGEVSAGSETVISAAEHLPQGTSKP